MNFISRNAQPLTIDQLRHAVPSAFASQPHESRSARYTFIPSVEVVEGLMKSGFLPFKAVESGYRDPSKRGFTKHMIRFRRDGDAVIPVVNDSFFEVVLINSHDGSSAYQLTAGVFRFVCANGAFVSDGTLDDIKVRHSGNVVHEVVQGAERVALQAPKVAETLGRWTQLQLTSGEQQAFADAARTIRFGDPEGKVDTPITAADLLQSRRSEDAKPDLWHTFNRVQENVIKGGLSAYGRDKGNRMRRVTTRGVNGIEQDVKLNRALWQLAERMAELKGERQVA